MMNVSVEHILESKVRRRDVSSMATWPTLLALALSTIESLCIFQPFSYSLSLSLPLFDI